MVEFCAMKNLQNLLIAAISVAGCNAIHETTVPEFKAEKVERTASFMVNHNIDAVFLLYDAFEERKWEEGWNPNLIYPSEEIIEEGTTFWTQGHGHEPYYLWRVSKFEPENYLIQYLVSTVNRYWTVTVSCHEQANNSTLTEVTYSFISLNQKGIELNKHALDRMYSRDLQDWKEAIDYYLENGRSLPRH